MNELQHISVTTAVVCTPQRSLVNDMKRGVCITPKHGKGRLSPPRKRVFNPMLFTDGSPRNWKEKRMTKRCCKNCRFWSSGCHTKKGACHEHNGNYVDSGTFPLTGEDYCCGARQQGENK